MSGEMIEEYWWSENRQVLTRQQHGIPGIRVLGA